MISDNELELMEFQLEGYKDVEILNAHWNHDDHTKKLIEVALELITELRLLRKETSIQADLLHRLGLG
jgi:hypothetical protein